MDIETLIVQDADKLDAFGAIGLTRIIEYNIANKIPMYVPNVPLYRNDFSVDKGDHDISVIHHLHNVYLRLGENFNTSTARNIVKPKVKLMQDFANMFIDEWK